MVQKLVQKRPGYFRAFLFFSLPTVAQNTVFLYSLDSRDMLHELKAEGQIPSSFAIIRAYTKNLLREEREAHKNVTSNGDARMHSALQIANEMIKRGATESPPRHFTPMQLLKLVYLCHGWMLGLYGRPLIKEDIQAWKYGPVIPELYQSIKVFRDSQIPEPIATSIQTEELDAYESTMIDQVMNMYGNHSGIALSQITHAPNTPWSLTFRPDATGLVISDDLIMDHYQRIYRERTQNAANSTAG